MDAKRYQQIQNVFDQAAVRSGPERDAFLDRACAGDPELRAEVDALLKFHEATEPDVFAEPVVEASRKRIEGVVLGGAGAAQPEHIGPYRIICEIGEGGMGVVWEAEQSDPKRRVAIKVIRPGLGSRQVIARFEAERQALAIMNHPNIARVFGAGETEGGLPYFVMELVEGEPITEYCDRHSLDITARLNLFCDVCSALQHAHQKGVIHRDVKPSNVLVTMADGGPSPKVIDFGVAKATEARLTEKTIFTQHGQMVGTPEYMSPEQTGCGAVDIDTRTDVYSLGVLLYELLAGVTPFDRAELRSAAYGEMQRIIRDYDPQKPSVRLSDLDGLPNIAAARRLQAKRLQTLVQGDLDWIVMKCIEKQRDRRYDSASAVADDIQRYFTHQPVSAGRPSASYRFRKFVRRNRAGVTVGAIVAGALVLGLAGTSGGLLWALDERERANAAADAEALAKTEAIARTEDAEWEAYVAKIAAADAALQLHDCGTARQHLALCPEKRRGWEWQRLWAALDDAEVVLQGHTARVWKVKFSGDDRRIVTGSYDGSVRVWNAGTGECIQVFREHRGTIACLDINSDGSLVASMASNAEILVWRADTGEIISRMDARDPAEWLVFSEDESRLYTSPAAHLVRVWDIATGTLVEDIQGMRSFSPVEGGRAVLDRPDGTLFVRDLGSGRTVPLGPGPGPNAWYRAAFSKDGSRVVTSGKTGPLQVWNTADGTAALMVEQSAARMPAALSSDGRRIVFSRSDDAILSLIDVETGSTIRELVGHAHETLFIGFVSDGERICSVSRDRTLRVWNSHDGTEQAVFHGHEQLITSFDISSDGSHVVTGSFDGTARVWNMSHADIRTQVNVPISPRMTLALSPDDRFVLTDDLAGNNRLIRLADGQTVLSLARRSWTSASFAGAGGVYLAAELDGDVSVRNIETGKVVGMLRGHEHRIDSAAISPDGTRFATGSPDATARIWDAKTFAELLILPSASGVREVVFSPDGSLVVTRSGKSRVWDAKTGEELFTLEQGNANAVYGIEFSPDSRTIVSWPFGATPLVQDARTGERLFELCGHEAPVISVSFDQSGERMITTSQDTTARVWNARTGALQLTLIGHRRSVDSAAFQPNGSRIVTGSFDETMRIWDADTGRLCAVISGHSGSIADMAFSRDGSRLVTVSGDGTFRSWDAVPLRDRSAN